MRKIIASLLVVFALCGCAWGVALRPGEEEFNNGQKFYTEGKLAEAFAEFEKGSVIGFSGCFSWMGIFYIDGLSVDKDIEKGIELLKKGADLGSPFGMAMAGGLFTGAFGDDNHDIPLGIEYLEKAIAANNPYSGAFFYMGRVYEYGIGKEQDTQKALEMYEKAKSLGFSAAAQQAIDRIKNPSIPAQTLMTEAEQNILKFDNNYKGKQLTVNGYVGEITEDTMTRGYRLRLQPRPGQGTWIGCLFSQENADVLADLEYRAPIKIRGMYQGKQQMQIEDIVLLDCEVVK